MNTPISFELAKLLKEKRYNKYCRWSYWEGWLTPHTPGYALEDGTTSQENYWDFERYYAPTIADVVMWLYEKHGIWIEVYYNNSRKKFYTFWNREEYTFNSPTEAYSAVIKYTLKHLI